MSEVSNLRNALRQLPWPVTLIGSYYNGRHNLMTASWVSQVSSSPPLVMLSISPERLTFELLTASGEFVLSILSAEQVRIAQFCGNQSGRRVKKVEVLGIRTAPGNLVKVPILPDCIANIECRVINAFPAGDHVLFIAEALAGVKSDQPVTPLVLWNQEWGTYTPSTQPH
ncbi:MAG: flavin reductase family protein [Ammonifex sp.]|nr:MAG: flavin reductase family protein [Ammonifex sp.]